MCAARETGARVAREEVAIDAYDQVLAEFSEREGMGPVAWTPRMLKRVADAASLSGRDRMREALNALGFPLK